MFNNTNGYSLSDIAAASGGHKGSGAFGDDYWWLILLFLFWGNGGYGGQRGGTTTREEIAAGFATNNLENGIRGIQQGLCDGFYAVNTGMLNGFAGVGTAVNAATTAITAQLTGMAADNAACCCATQTAIREGLCDLNYNLATQANATQRTIADATRDIIDNNNAGVRSILDFLTQDKIATLTAENQSLKFAASQATQNAFIVANQEAQTAELIRRLGRDVPVPAYVVPNPNCCYGTPSVSNCGCSF